MVKYNRNRKGENKRSWAIDFADRAPCFQAPQQVNTYWTFSILSHFAYLVKQKWKRSAVDPITSKPTDRRSQGSSIENFIGAHS